MGFSADTGALDPQEAPLPNKLLLFVEAYETSDLTNADNGCKITTNGHYKLTNPDQALGEVIRNSVHNQIDNAGARARSGVQDARFPGTNSAQISKGASPGAANGIYKGAADLSGSTSDCVNGVFCGGRRFGEPCSGRGLCNYQDGTCQCHSGYAGNACQQVEEMA